MLCFVYSCPAKRRTQKDGLVHGGGYRKEDESSKRWMQRWWNETGRYPTVEERLNHIENIWPNLLRDVYRLEIQAGG